MILATLVGLAVVAAFIFAPYGVGRLIFKDDKPTGVDERAGVWVAGALALVMVYFLLLGSYYLGDAILSAV